jgi:hypothetical protein
MDFEPTLMSIAEQKGLGWLPRKLDYFDEPIREAHRDRVAGKARPQREKRPGDMTSDDLPRSQR